MTPVTMSRSSNVLTIPIRVRSKAMPPAIAPERNAVIHGEELLVVMPPPLSLRSSEPLAEDAGRPQDENEYEDDEGDSVFQLVGSRNPVAVQEQDRADGLGDAQDQAAQRSSRDVADAAQNGRGEGFDSGDEAHEECDLPID